MTKWVKNNSGTTKTWVGQEISNQAYYQIQSVEDKKWAENSTVLSDIASGDIIIAKSDSGADDITDVNAAIVYLKGLSVEISTMPAPSPFASKYIDGKSLYTRVHGVESTISIGTNNIDFTVPYTQAKFNALEIVNADVGDRVNLKVLDSVSGVLTTIPYYELNQFGFNIYLPDGFYVRESKYDADLVSGLIIRLEYTSAVAKTIKFNVILHELK